MNGNLIRATDLGVGSVFHRTAYHLTEDDPAVTVLRGPEPRLDIFGRTMLGFWCRREDTGAEGWFLLGPTGVVRSVPS